MRTLIATLLLAATVQAAPVPPAKTPDPLGRAFFGVREPGGGAPNAFNGVVIGEVIPGTGADKAGLEEGDRIMSVGGTKVDYFYQLQEQLRMYRPGAVIKVEIERKGKKQDKTVRLGEAPEPEARVIEEP